MNNLNKENVTAISALLVHAAKIDEIYTDQEKKLIKNFIKSYLKNEEINETLKKAEEIENNSNQLLNFTNIIKKESMDFKKDIIEHLWRVVISDNTVDQYESNLVRRICKLTDCVDVCPVDCFYEGENFLAINPEECIDCGVCEPECPLDAIKADTDESVKDMDKWLLINKKFSAIWPNISKKKEPMKDHEKFKNIKDKYDKHFSEKPGK